MFFSTNIEQYRWLLNPAFFKRLATSGRDENYLSGSDANKFIPPILRLIQLKRTSATQITGIPGKGSYRIGAEIPPVRWLTIELEMKKLALERYAVVHSLCTGNLGAGYDAEAQTGLRNMTYHRRLCLTVLTPELDKVGITEDRRDRLARSYLRYGDRGASFFFDQTKPDATLPVYRDRTSLF